MQSELFSAQLEERLHGLIDNVFADDGVLAKRVPGYRVREGQLKMAKAVAHGFAHRRHQLIEAPTGTGKSFGAGLPVALGCALEGETAIYVTANIALQEQLDKKDMPQIKSIVGEISGQGDATDFRVSIIKGMSNYVCLNKMQDSIKSGELGDHWQTVIPDWVKRSKKGDRSELDEFPPDEVWSKVSTGSDDCLRKSCPDRDECFVYRNREEAARSHFVVTNYHLFFVNQILTAAGAPGLLPDADVVIFDEFHEAPEIAMSFRGYSMGHHRWSQARGILRRAGDQGNREALNLVRSLDTHGDMLMKAYESRFDEQGEEQVLDRPLGTDCGMVNVLRQARTFLNKQADDNDQATEGRRTQAARLEAAAKTLSKVIHDLEATSYGFHVKTDRSAGTFSKEFVRGTAEKPGTVFEENMVFFLEKDGRGKVRLACKALDTASFFRSHVFEQVTAIMMSATLSAKGSFEFIRGQVGLEVDEHDPLVVDTPFDPQNVLVVVPEEGFPQPNENSHPLAVAGAMLSVYQSMNTGGMMGLFTSYAGMNTAATRMREELGKDENIFVQGELGKMQIIQRFIRAHERGEKAVVLATGSFWQGVDVPGQALSVVCIDKMPFTPPDDPVMRFLEQKTTSAFSKYSVPLCVIRLKQGVGRLIRRVTDYGVVVLLDPRAANKKRKYHKAVQSAFPAGCYVSSDIEDVHKFLEEKADEHAQS